MLKRVFLLGAAALLGQAACLGSYDASTPSSVVTDDSVSNAPPAVRPVSPDESTSLWMQYGDPAVLAARAADEGPLAVASRRHACYKFRYHTLGQVMADLGVNMRNTNDTANTTAASILPLELSIKSPTDPTTFCNGLITGTVGVATERAAKVAQAARYLYCTSRLTLGFPPYGARLPEPTGLTTASATKQFDTLAAAAIEIANDNLSKATRCMDSAGTKAVLFNADNTCNKDGMACLQGYTPTTEQINLCNRLVTSAAGSAATNVTLPSGGTIAVAAITATDAGKRIAAAAVLANALLCK